MASFNKVILVGNLTRDPQVRYTTGGTAVTDIGLAVNYQWFDKQSNTRKEEVTFVDVTLWGRLAEVAGEYLAKGRPVLIEGRLQLDSWDDKDTGQKRSRLKVVGENMQMLGSRDGSGGGGGRSGGPGNASAPHGSSYQSDPGGYQAEPPHDSGFDAGPSGPSGPPSDDVPF